MSLFIVLSILIISSKVRAEDESKICSAQNIFNSYTTLLDRIKASKENPETQITFYEGLNELRTTIGTCKLIKLEKPIELKQLLTIFEETLNTKYNSRVYECLKGIVQHFTKELKESALDQFNALMTYGLEMAILGTETPLQFPEENVQLAFILENCGNKIATTTTTTTTPTPTTTTKKPSGGFWFG